MIGSKHLTPEQAVSLAEARGTDTARHHLESCARCQGRVAELAELMARVGADTVPEPSPLFWEHLSARIGRAIDNEPEQRTWPSWLHWRGWKPASAVALAVMVLGVTLVTLQRRDAPSGVANDAAGRGATVASSVAAAEPTVPALDDGIWDVVAVLSAELAGDEAEAGSLEPQPGTAERVVEQLTADEQGELARLLEAEIARRPS